MYIKGEGTEKNIDKAKNLLTMAYENNYKDEVIAIKNKYNLDNR